MNDSTVSSEISAPYAEALMSIAKDRDLADRFGQDARQMIETLDVSVELVQLFENPLVSPAIKKGVLRQVAADQVDPVMLSFLLLLVDRGRIMFLKPILQQYQTLLRELRQTVLAEVTAAVELSGEQQASIRQRVTEITGAEQVDLAVEIDASLIGGLIIKVGSQVIDASLRGQLRRIGLQLDAAA